MINIEKKNLLMSKMTDFYVLRMSVACRSTGVFCYANCSEVVNGCDSHTCQNNGTCIDYGNGSYSCQCETIALKVHAGTVYRYDFSVYLAVISYSILVGVIVLHNFCADELYWNKICYFLKYLALM